MTQDTRKDPRAKVLTMTVRYKSATLDEFIEHHSHDVSRGGMFIKTPSPFPPGTLLKFEVRIAGEQRVLQGVGRVVWKRESSEVADARPAGMGVKFIKIDDESRKIIDQLVVARGDAASQFDQGEGQPGAPESASSRPTEPNAVTPLAPAATTGPATVTRAARKSTMIGLGAMQAAKPPESPGEGSDAFFPPAPSDIDMPAPEDRTVMRQAAELLQEALREAGGSLDEVGSSEVSAKAKKAPDASKPAGAAPAAEEGAASASQSKLPAQPVVATQSVRDPGRGEKVQKPLESKSVIVNTRPRDEITQPAARRPGAPATAAAVSRSEPPRSRSAAMQEAAGAAAESGGGGRVVLMLAVLAGAAAGVYFMTRSPEPAPAPEPPIQAVQSPAEIRPVPSPERARMAEPVVTPSAAAVATGSAPIASGVATPGSAAAAVPAPAPAAASAAVPKPQAPAAAVPAPKPAAPRPPKPKQPAPEAAPPPSEVVAPADPAPTPPAPTPTPSPAPVEPPPKPAPTAAPAPKPAPPAAPAPKPTPKPSDTAGDNPY